MEKTKKRQMTIIGLTACATLSLILVSTIGLDGGKHFFADEGSQYSITFNATTNKIGTETFSASQVHTGSGYAVTGLGNQIGFDYNSFYNPTGVWQIMKAGGYFTNTDPIHGMKSLSLTKGSASASIQVFWSNTLTFDDTKSATYDSTSPLTVTCDFNAYLPNYFKVLALGSSNSSIKSGLLSFSCYNTYPTLNVTSESETKGTVAGSGVYKIGDSVTVSATPKTGYKFAGWYNGTSLLSTDASYTFTMPASGDEYSLVARFAPITYNVTLASEDETKGTVAGSGSYDYTSSVTVVATPKQGYKFVGWYNGTSLVSSANPYTFTMPYNDVSYVAKFDLASYALALTSDSTKGTVSGAGTYQYTGAVTLTATANAGYTFAGWYNGETFVSSDNPYSFTMPYNDLSYEARFSTNNYTVTLTPTEVATTPVGTCSVTGAGTYSYASSVTITAAPQEGYGFLGWYDGSTLVSSSNPYTFAMPSKDLSYAAKYSKKYHLSVASTDEAKGTVSGAGDFPYTSSVTVTGTGIGYYNRANWYDDSLNVVSGDITYTFVMPESDVNLSADFYKILGSSFYLGKYPQTVVEDSATLTALASAMDTDSDGYLEYGDAEYKKVTGAPYGSGYKSASWNVTFSSGTAYYFKVEPIEWRVLSGKGTATGLVMSEKVLTNTPYYTSNYGRTISGSGVFPNNYQYSTIRAMLNGLDGSSYSVANFAGKGFLDVAFTETEKAYIATTTVDNSAATTGSSSNSFACANTSDKIFALSYQDLLNTSYGFNSYELNNDKARTGTLTDYARATGAVMSTSGKSWWWSRSPNANSSGSAVNVYFDGYLNCNGVLDAYYGVRPSFVVDIG